LAVSKVSRQCGALVDLPFGPTIFDCYVSAFIKSCFAKASAKCSKAGREALWRFAAQISDDRQSGLLRSRCERPCARSADERDEFTPLHYSHPPDADEGIVTIGSAVLKEPADVRFVSKADICGATRHVRFTPERGHSLLASAAGTSG